jgi:hypothetical protein
MAALSGYPSSDARPTRAEISETLECVSDPASTRSPSLPKGYGERN